MDEDVNSDGQWANDSGSGKEGQLRRPMNAFLIFCKKHRPIVRDKNPHLDNRAVTKILGELWGNLPATEKDSYLEVAKDFRDAFMRANPDYHWHTGKRDNLPAFKPPANRPGLSSPSNAQNEKIVFGKLADPSNMGGLEALLKTGAVVETKAVPIREMPTVDLDVKKESPACASSTLSTTENTRALMHLAEMCTNGRPVNQQASSQRREIIVHPFGINPNPQPVPDQKADSSKESSIPKVVGRQVFSIRPVTPGGTTSASRVVRTYPVHVTRAGMGKLKQSDNVNQSNFSKPRSSEIHKTSARSETENPTLKYMKTLEKVSLPLAMPLMVNKMIETVLCKEHEEDKMRLAKKLECTETSLDDEDDKSPQKNELIKSVKENPNLIATKSEMIERKPSLTFSQIQETLIRKAMEDSSSIVVEQKSAQMPTFKSRVSSDIARNISAFSTPVNSNGPPSSSNALTKFSPTTGLKTNGAPQIKTENITPFSKTNAMDNRMLPSVLDTEPKKAIHLIEDRIKEEIQNSVFPQRSRSDSFDLTCSEEFKESESDSPKQSDIKAKQSFGKDDTDKHVDKLRNQIESELTSHLMANAGVLSTYHNQLGLARDHNNLSRDANRVQGQFQSLQPTAIPSFTKYENNDAVKIESEISNDSKVMRSRDDNYLPPKKRGRNFISQSSMRLTPDINLEKNIWLKEAEKKDKITIQDTKSLEVFSNKGIKAQNGVKSVKNGTKPVPSTNNRLKRRRKNVNEVNSDTPKQKVGSPKGIVGNPEAEDTFDEEDEDESGVRKSKRRNRGQKYQELLSQGLLQIGRHKRIDAAGETSQETGTGLRGRKRAVSESISQGMLSPDRPSVIEYDLDAHLAELPACRVENVPTDQHKPSSTRRLKQKSNSAHNLKTAAVEDGLPKTKKSEEKSEPESSDTLTEESKDLNIAQLRQTQLQSQASHIGGKVAGHVSGSQKRKQRRCPITKLHQLPKSSTHSDGNESNNNDTEPKDTNACHVSSTANLKSRESTVATSQSNSCSRAYNVNFATLVDVAVAETEKLSRQSSGTEIAVGCK